MGKLKDFWPEYLALHSRNGTRWFHFAGVLACWFVIAMAVLRGEFWYILAGPMVGYFLAFSGHFWVEHNTPATFRNPVLSFFCDHYLAWQIIRGKLN